MTMALLVMTAVSTMAVDITYSLKTHVDGRTMTQTVTGLSAGSALSLPGDMRRGYTTYKYYSDAALTNEITAVPNADATVYVDYVFNAPFVVSPSIYNYQGVVLRGPYREGPYATFNAVGQVVDHDYGVRNLVYVGDSYCLWLWSPNAKAYITWEEGSARRITTEEQPLVGWQLLKNYNYGDTSGSGEQNNTRYSLGTYEEGRNNAKYLVYGDGTYRTDNSQYSNNLSIELNNSNFTQQTTSFSTTDRTYKTTMKWNPTTNELCSGLTSIFSYVWGGATITYNISYYIIQDYYPYGIRQFFATPLKNAVIPSNPSNSDAPGAKTKLDELMATDIYEYTFYKDAALTQPYAEGEYTPSGKNVTVYVKEHYLPGHEESFVCDRWITICLNYGIENVENFFGADAVVVNKFTGLDVSGNKYHLKFTKVNTIEANTPYMFKAHNVLSGKYLTLFKTATPYDNGNPESLSIEHADKNTIVSMRGTFGVYDEETKTLSDFQLPASTDNCYTYFLGYTKSNDPESPSYAADWADETPKFYRVVAEHPRFIKPFHCYFDIKDMVDGVGAKSVSIVTETETGIREVVNPDGTSYPVANIYNMNGQLIRANATDTEGLPKGLYIMGGRKLIVK